MEYTTKFSIGQRVATISSDYARKIVGCDACQKTGKIKINAEDYVCPKCHGASAYPQVCGSKYYVSHEGVIGKVQIEHMVPYRGNNHFDVTDALIEDGGAPDYEVNYMIDETGVGSGTVWPQNRLFPSREVAQAECDRLNAKLNLIDTGTLLPKEY